MGTKKQAGNGQRPSGIGEDFVGRQGPEQIASLEEKKEEELLSRRTDRKGKKATIAERK